MNLSELLHHREQEPQWEDLGEKREGQDRERRQRSNPRQWTW